MLDGLSKRWKRSKRKTLFVGAAIALIAALLVGMIAFGCSMKVIPAGEMAVSSLSRLENGDLAFILQTADGTGIRELSHYEMDGTLYITATTTSFPLFQHRKVRKAVGSFIQRIPVSSRFVIRSSQGHNCLSGM